MESDKERMTIMEIIDSNVVMGSVYVCEGVIWRDGYFKNVP